MIPTKRYRITIEVEVVESDGPWESDDEVRLRGIVASVVRGVAEDLREIGEVSVEEIES